MNHKDQRKMQKSPSMKKQGLGENWRKKGAKACKLLEKTCAASRTIARMIGQYKQHHARDVSHDTRDESFSGLFLTCSDCFKRGLLASC